MKTLKHAIWFALTLLLLAACGNRVDLVPPAAPEGERSIIPEAETQKARSNLILD